MTNDRDAKINEEINEKLRELNKLFWVYYAKGITALVVPKDIKPYLWDIHHRPVSDVKIFDDTVL